MKQTKLIKKNPIFRRKEYIHNDIEKQCEQRDTDVTWKFRNKKKRTLLKGK